MSLPWLRKKPAAKNCKLDGDVCEVRGNSKLLRRAFRNLLENAHKHGEPPVGVQVTADGPFVRIRIYDSGPGITEALRNQVFEPFYRAPGKQNVQGYGLGLSLVKQIAQTHGGDVTWIDDGPTNSTVEMTLVVLS